MYIASILTWNLSEIEQFMFIQDGQLVDDEEDELEEKDMSTCEKDNLTVLGQGVTHPINGEDKFVLEEIEPTLPYNQIWLFLI